MERLRELVLDMLVALALCGCTCGLAGCGRTKAEAEQPSRFEVECVASHGKVFYLDYMAVEMLTDRETGRQWVVVCTEKGVAMTPLEGGDDGTVSE